MKKTIFKILFLILALVTAIPPSRAEETLTVADGTGTSTNSAAPIWGGKFNSTGRVQVLYPSSMLTDMSGKNITSVTFYHKGYPYFSGGTVDIYIGETTNTSLSGLQAQNTLTKVKTVSGITTVMNSDYSFTFTFDTPFQYNGGNLIIETHVTAKGTNDRSNFYGQSSGGTTVVATNYGSISGSGYSSTMYPKATFSYESGGTVTNQVATPTFSPAEGTYNEAQNVTISCDTEGATISYSIDGGTTWNAYTGAITVSATTTIMAKASKDGMTDSETATATYTINKLPSGPTSQKTVFDGKDTDGHLPLYMPSYYQESNQMIYPASELTDLVNTTITGLKFYTTGLIFDGSFSVSLGTTSQSSYSSATAITGLTQVVQSATATDGVTEFDITFTTPFLYTGQNLVVQIDVLNQGTSRYRTTYFYGEGQDVNTGFNDYISYGNHYNNLVQFMPKTTFTYIQGEVLEQVETPTFTPVAGTYMGTQAVTIVCATEGATIYYTTDGSEPTTASNLYTGAITVSETMTIKAIAVKDGMADSDMASATYTIEIPADYAASVSPNGGTIAFGTANPDENESKTRTITITNTGLQPITPSLSDLTAPFSTDYTATQLASGESVTITITFTPTTQGDATAQATLSFGNGINDIHFTLTGKGGKLDENDHSAIYDYNYTWIDSNGKERTNNLQETATEPEQIIAMLREIYMNPEIPGNLYRGYDENGVLEKDKNGNNWLVTYPAIGSLVQNTENDTYTYQYNDAYGWNIPTNHDIQAETIKSPSAKYGYNYKTFDSYEYQPNQDGLTIILMEMNDNPEGSDLVENMSSTTTDYASLRDMFKTLFKSARIITTYIETGNDQDKNAGTLFKIDADKLNRFFFLAKGRLRASDNSAKDPGTDWGVNGDPSMRWRTDDKESTATWADKFNMAPFYNMFEQFSPVALAQGTASSDIYQEMIDMQSYPVEHDCQSIPFSKLPQSVEINGHTYEYGHEFNMYGKDSQSDDCQDVRDMMFFVPKYRMMEHYDATYTTTSQRDESSSDVFVNYHQNAEGSTQKYAPTLGLYVIHQYEITGEKQDQENIYDLNLNWKSNLLDFLPGAMGEYTLYRVTTSADGQKSYEPVTTLTSNQTTYVDHIAMQETGQEVTYVVQGQDKTRFLSLQMSNEESFIIPGTDETLLLTLKLANDYSRFDPMQERNYYSNELLVTNNMAPYVTDDDLAANGATFTIYRYYGEGEDEVEVPVATLTPVAGQMKLNIAWANQRGNGTDAQNYYSWINMPNKEAVAYSIKDNNAVAFDNFTLFDNFSESVTHNDHPSQYRYQVKFTYGDNTAYSNKVSVYIHKTEMDVQGYTKQQIDNDTNHELDTDIRYIDEQVKYSSKQEILRYDAFRWKEGSENERKIMTSSTIDATTLMVTDDEVPPTGEADNGGSAYTLKMDGNTQGAVDVNMEESSTATFKDYIVNKEAGMYYFAPVVETFTGRSDYNTYGAPVQQSGVATIEAKVSEAIMSKNTFTVDNDPNLYAHYNVTLDLSKLLIPENQNDALKDYDLYKVRVWRQVDVDLLNEQVFTGNNTGANRAERISGDYMMEEVDYNQFSRSAVNNETHSSAYKLGSNTNLTKFHSNWNRNGSNEVMGTFGARKLRQTAQETGVIESLPMHFIVRAYYTRTANIPESASPNTLRSANRGVDNAADQKYYVAEYEFDYTLTGENIVTAVPSVMVDRQATSVTYYNVTGQQSSKPFDGLNIVVTRYNDGTTDTAKVLH